MKQMMYTSQEVDAAMCLWEECIMRQVSWRNEHGITDTGPPMFDWLRGGEGAASARDMCVCLAKDLEESWKVAHEKYGFDDSFDWEFVPRWADEAMDLTEWENLTPRWHKYLAWKVTERWKSETRS